jgi:YesN/AraC family two-component response regulator
VNNVELLEKALGAIRRVTEKRHNDRLLKYFAQKMPEMKQKAIGMLLARGTDKNELLFNLEFHGIPVIFEGVVLSLDSDKNAEFAVDKLKATLDGLGIRCVRTLGEHAEFVMVADMTPDEAQKVCGKLIEEWIASDLGILSIGVSAQFQGLESIADAYKEAQRARDNKLFPTISAVTLFGHSHAVKHVIIDTIRYIEKNYMNDIGINAVADKLFISTYHLMHLLKSEIGKTFNELLTEYRIYIAKKLLCGELYDAEESGCAVGMTNFKYFSQVFKREVGITPSQYMKRNRKIEE